MSSDGFLVSSAEAKKEVLQADSEPTLFEFTEPNERIGPDTDLCQAERERLTRLNEVVDDFGFEMVTKIVSLEDDSTLPVLTFRYFVVATLLACTAATLGTIYAYKPQGLSLPTSFLLLVSYFIAKALEMVLPHGILNPGPFNKKEHALIVVTASSAGLALATEIIASEYLFYGYTVPTGIGILLVLSSQFVGYGFAGFFRQSLVYPRKAFYPGSLTQVTLYENLHATGGGISKSMTKYFFILVVVTFVYEWLPQYIAPALQGVSVICLATAHLKSPGISQIFGGTTANEGMGLFAFSFDWNAISATGNPMVYPWSSMINVAIGVLLCTILMPTMYFTNTWDAQSYPWMGLGIYSPKSQDLYNQTFILYANHNINFTAVDILGLPGMATSYCLYIMGGNMMVTAGIVHIFLHFWPDVKEGFKNIFATESTNQDPYYVIMKKYTEVPLWWYLSLFTMFFTVGLVVCVTTQVLDWYMYIIATCLSFIFVFASGFLAAVTGFGIPVGSVIQMLGGFIKPGNPVGNMYFTLFGSTSTSQATGMLADLKIGQYMKIPPRFLFLGQMYGTFIGAVVGYFLTVSIVTKNADLLVTIHGSTQWNGATVQNFNSQAITWGGLAKQLYAPGAPYQWVFYSFFVGLGAPFVFLGLHKIFPKVGFHYINVAIISSYLGYFCSGSNSSVFTYFIIAAFTQFYLRRYKPHIFNKYQYLTAAGLDAGNNLTVLMVALTVGGVITSHAITFPWWFMNPNFIEGMWYQDGCYQQVNDPMWQAAQNTTTEA
ncbi:OPT oligopeptide transporter protein-domain-containing protein [Chytriomyces sp. MP71]|nr:OPT oligopeptide transporter protein-domain-containing protein [Chytriomyces sp. MP71]